MNEFLYSLNQTGHRSQSKARIMMPQSALPDVTFPGIASKSQEDPSVHKGRLAAGLVAPRRPSAAWSHILCDWKSFALAFGGG